MWPISTGPLIIIYSFLAVFFFKFGNDKFTVWQKSCHLWSWRTTKITWPVVKQLESEKAYLTAKTLPKFTHIDLLKPQNSQLQRWKSSGVYKKKKPSSKSDPFSNFTWPLTTCLRFTLRSKHWFGSARQLLLRTVCGPERPSPFPLLQSFTRPRHLKSQCQPEHFGEN